MDINQTAYDLFYKKLGEWSADLAEQAEYDGFDQKPDLTGHKINSKNLAWQRTIILTKSPIEQILCSGMMFLTDGYNDINSSNDYVPDYVGHFGTYFIPQSPVGNYTADFLVVCQHHEQMKIIAIECDGHDYHERTKQQAAHDKKRDRFFTSQGLKILRFTGSEIFSKTDDCIEEIQSLIEITMEEILVDAGKIQPRKKAV